VPHSTPAATSKDAPKRAVPQRANDMTEQLQERRGERESRRGAAQETGEQAEV
jgi:hypothetical protein